MPAPRTFRTLVAALAMATLVGIPARAAEPALTDLQVFPPAINLTTDRDRQTIIAQATFDDGITRYDIEQEHHDHLVCVKCGKIQEFECDMIEESQRQIAARYGFRILRHRHELYGHCAECAERAQRE